MYPLTSTIEVAMLLQRTTAQFPAQPTDLTIAKSSISGAVTVSFKETDVCEQTQGVKAYSGFVNLPASVLTDVANYGVHMFFLYFEARNNPSTAPLGIYLAGGPGEASSYSAMSSENGPCWVNVDSMGTVNGSWSFNNYMNMLYIDQPVQTGYSYSTLVNGTFDILEGSVITPGVIDPANPPTANITYGYGTWPSQEFKRTANNTVIASKTLWHFAEHWLSSFPGYNTTSSDIAIIGNSWAGYYVPETAAIFQKAFQNLSSTTHPLARHRIDTIGITNGCIDLETSLLGYPEYAYNNTYGVRFASEEQYNSALNNYTKSGGCHDLIKASRIAGNEYDPMYTASNASVNELCMEPYAFCAENVVAFPIIDERWAMDVAQNASPVVCDHWIPVNDFLNNGTTQARLGVGLNFTEGSNVVSQDFGNPTPLMALLPANASSGDAIRQNGVPNLEYLLSQGVKVAFIYGDRDYRCPWTGAEMTALALQWDGQVGFNQAGYEVMDQTNNSSSQSGTNELNGDQEPDQGLGLAVQQRQALVKQHGLFSFTRVMNAGHSVSAFAPSTVAEIMRRTVTGKDVVSGQVNVATSANSYSTTGPTTSWQWKNEFPQLNYTFTCMVAGKWSKTNPWAPILAAEAAYAASAQ